AALPVLPVLRPARQLIARQAAGHGVWGTGFPRCLEADLACVRRGLRAPGWTQAPGPGCRTAEVRDCLGCSATRSSRSAPPGSARRDYLRTRNRRMVTVPDRVPLTGSRSILALPGLSASILLPTS